MAAFHSLAVMGCRTWLDSKKGALLAPTALVAAPMFNLRALPLSGGLRRLLQIFQSWVVEPGATHYGATDLTACSVLATLAQWLTNPAQHLLQRRDRG